MAQATVRAYNSALQTWHVEHQLLQGIPGTEPAYAELMTRTLAGVRKSLAKEQRARRLTQAHVTPGVRMHQLDLARRALLPDGSTPQQRMEWAAMRLAIEGMFRPNELFGSKSAGRPPVAATQFTFRACLADRREEVPCASHTGVSPRYLWVQLGVQKNDPHAEKGARRIEDAVTVRAVWDWLCERLRLGETRPEAFAQPGMRPLSGTRMKELLREHVDAKFRLKDFRKGGAAMRVARGDSLAAIQAVAGWKGEQMVRTYAGPEAFVERELLMSAAAEMRPPAASAAAAASR